MAHVSCGKGHFYDSDVNSSCPFCGVDGVQLDIGATQAAPGASAAQRPGTRDVGVTRAARGAGEAPADDGGRTRAVWTKKFGGIDPVVGWLVCIEGQDKGRDFRIHTERNFIGRDPAMDVAVAGDNSISRHNHAVISYNPKRHTFTVAPGDGRGLTYLNDDELLGPQPLKPYDIIELGASKLLFVPFCGEQFTWPVDAAPSV